MTSTEVVAGRVVAVLLADGWHRIVPGSFSAGPLSFGAGTGTGAGEGASVLGFRFEEADTGSPYTPTTLAGPLDSIIAVRQAAPAVRPIGNRGPARTAYNGRQTDRTRPRAGAAR
jgi:hypothetical protein